MGFSHPAGVARAEDGEGAGVTQSTLSNADKPRLATQSQHIKRLMSDGRWRTFAEIREALLVNHAVFTSEAGVSARLRELRKPSHGAWIVDRTRISDGIWAYRMRAGEARQLTLGEIL